MPGETGFFRDRTVLLFLELQGSEEDQHVNYARSVQVCPSKTLKHDDRTA